MKKKLLCALLTFIMCAGLLPATAPAETTVPTVPTVEGKNIYANGVPIVIEARNPSTYDTWIYYMDGDEKVDIDLNPDGMEEFTIYGGAKNGTVDSTSITMTGGMVGDIYGGCDGGTVEGNTSVTISGGYVEGRTYGGGNKGTIKGNTSVTVSGGTLDDWAYGGSYDGTVEGNSSFELTGNSVANYYIFGGSDGGTVEGNTSVVLSSGWCNAKQFVCGGSYDGTVEGNSSVTMTGGVVGTDTSGIYGGNWKGTVKGNTSVTITGGTVNCRVCGGSWEETINGNASVTISGGTVKGSVYGAGRYDNIIDGNATIILFDGTVKGNVSRTIDASSVVKGNWQIVRGGTNVNGTIDAPDGSLEKNGNAYELTGKVVLTQDIVDAIKKGAIIVGDGDELLIPDDVKMGDLTVNYVIEAISADTALGTASGGVYEEGTDATVTATANSGYQFAKWMENGEQVSIDNPYIFKAEAPRTLTAVFANELVIHTESLLNGRIYDKYNQTIEAAGDGTITWSIAGDLPDGLSFNAGVISGTPEEVGSFPIVVTATNGIVRTTKTYTLEIDGLTPDFTEPTAVEGLIYTGEAHALVLAGDTDDGEMQYSMDKQNWSTDIPVGTDAKTYTVYYKVDGDATHKDSEVGSVRVTIGKKELTIFSVTMKEKAFDGKTAAEAEGITLNGIIAEDDVSVDFSDLKVSYTADSVYVGDTDKKADVTAISLTGEHADNYSISPVDGVTVAGKIIAGDYDLSSIPANMYAGDTYTADMIRNAVPNAGEVTISGIVAEDSTIDTAKLADLKDGVISAKAAGRIVVTYSIAENDLNADEFAEYNASGKQTVVVEISRRPSSGGGGSSTSVKADDDKVTVNTSGSNISEKDAEKAIDTAVENDSDEIEIITNKDKVTLPENLTETITDETDADLVVETKNGTVTIPDSTLEDLNAEGKVTVEVTKDKVTISDENGELSDIGKIEVTVPYKENSETDNVAVEVTKADGTKEVIEDVYDGKNSVTFDADGSVTFVIIDDYVPGAEIPVAPEHPAENPFRDVSETDWFYKAVMYVSDNGLMSGVDADKFGPSWNTTRGMITTILWRMEGKPAAGEVPFTDVKADMYYADAIAWAAEKGIVSGYDEPFGPDDNITREQLASILWRYAKYKGYDVSVGEDTNILSYEDAFNISEYAIPAMQWACGAGIISGNDDGTLNPGGHAQRAHAAQMLMKFLENVK